MRIVLLAAVLALGGVFALPVPSPVSAQGTDTLLQNELCRADPYSEDCICAEVRQLALFPIEMDPVTGNAASSDMDGIAPVLNPGGFWVDGANEDADVTAGISGAKPTELVYIQSDRYGQQCALSYWRENTRRLWVFAVSVGAVLTAIGMVMVGITYMQHTASGMDLSRARLQLIRIFIGIVILACSMVVWEGVNAFLFSDIQSWTFERNVFHDFE